MQTVQFLLQGQCAATSQLHVQRRHGCRSSKQILVKLHAHAQVCFDDLPDKCTCSRLDVSCMRDSLLTVGEFSALDCQWLLQCATTNHSQGIEVTSSMHCAGAAAQPQTSQPPVAKALPTVQQQGSMSTHGTAKILSRLRGPGADGSASRMPAAVPPALNWAPAPPGYRTTNSPPCMPQPQITGTQQQPSASAWPQHSATMRQPLAPVHRQQSSIVCPSVNPQPQCEAKGHDLSRSQQLALENAGLSHSQSSIDL